MWNLLSRIGSTDPKFTNMQKGCYHTSVPPLMASPLLPMQDKQFSYIKGSCNGLMKMTPTNYTTTKKESEENSSQKIKNMCNNNSNNNKKKKKRRRRRKKKSRNNQTKTPEMNCQRQRQLSTCSDDSFIICFDRQSDSSDNETETEDFSSSDCVVPYKKVHFATDSELCEVHSMIVWSYAYQAARKGPWEEYARDRCRFKKRIEHTERLIGHIFSKDHRSKIYEQRFS